MTSEGLQAEVERLRAEVEGYRQRELDQLRSRLAEAESAAAHYKAEAHRNAEVGRQIASEYEKEIITLRAQLEASRGIDARSKRFQS